MKVHSPIVFVSLVLTMIGQAQESKNELDFSLLRQNDEIRITDGEQRLYYRLKQLSLGKASTLSFGGSYRTQAETFINEQFVAEEAQSDVWFLNRFQLHGHLKMADRFELFAELNASIITSKQNLAPVDRDKLSFNQLFLRYRLSEQWNVLVGRQNMRLGSGRLIDIREGPNVRLSFDMAQVQFQDNNSAVTGFYAVPVRVEEGVFDNEALDFQESVGGLYWTQHWTKTSSTDLYAFYKEEAMKTWDSGTADDNRLSIGLRHFGSWKSLTYNNEFVFQTGRFGNQDITAWTASFNIEYPVSFLGQNSVLGLKTEAISGDSNPDDTRLNTFDGLYPRGAYFGRVARIGPSNLFDIHPYFDTRWGKLNFQFDYVAFWRFSRQDGVYGPPLNLQYPAVNERRFIGHQLGSIAAYEVNSHLSLELEANVIFPGDFLSESGLDNTLFHSVFTAEFKF